MNNPLNAFLSQVDLKKSIGSSIGSLFNRDPFLDLFYPLCRYTKLFLPPKTFLIFALFYADDTILYATVSSLNQTIASLALYIYILKFSDHT